VCTPEGNVLWDCVSLIDDATVTIINALGGLRAIAISHPHFYTTLSIGAAHSATCRFISMPMTPIG
jgi:hypothetical protein